MYVWLSGSATCVCLQFLFKANTAAKGVLLLMYGVQPAWAVATCMSAAHENLPLPPLQLSSVYTRCILPLRMQNVLALGLFKGQK